MGCLSGVTSSLPKNDQCNLHCAVAKVRQEHPPAVELKAKLNIIFHGDTVRPINIMKRFYQDRKAKAFINFYYRKFVGPASSFSCEPEYNEYYI